MVLEENPNAASQPSQEKGTMPLPHLSQSTGLMGNWSRLVRNPVQRYQGWEGGVNSGRDASEVKPLIMITNWSWLLERQAAAVGRSAFEVFPACCRVPGPLAWGDAGTMWLPVGKNVMRRQGDGAQDGWRVDGLTGPAGGVVTGDQYGMPQWDERVREHGRMMWKLGRLGGEPKCSTRMTHFCLKSSFPIFGLTKIKHLMPKSSIFIRT